ncbi:acyl carrier protein [Flavobacterium sp. LB3P122]|uniref:acyl carrier protein n=1 Tax=Flavobacterium algoriphilum TaxID=3398738 RepID=UPI003A891FB5
MIREELFGKLQEIFRDIFDDETLEISDSTNSSDIDDWDSINHINLVVAIENEIHIKFSFDDLAALKNVGAMVDLMMVKMTK